MPRRTTLVLALILLIIGGALRYHFFYLKQYGLKLLIVISIAIFVCSILMSLLKARSVTYKDSLICAVVVAILCGFSYESVAGNKRKNQHYLEQLAGIVNRFSEKNARLPVSIEEALAPGEMLPNRGDADGNSLQYIRISNRGFVLRSLGSDARYGTAARGVVQLNYLNGNSVSFEEFTSWIEANGTDEEKESVKAYFRTSQRD